MERLRDSTSTKTGPCPGYGAICSLYLGVKRRWEHETDRRDVTTVVIPTSARGLRRGWGRFELHNEQFGIVVFRGNRFGRFWFRRFWFRRHARHGRNIGNHNCIVARRS